MAQMKKGMIEVIERCKCKNIQQKVDVRSQVKAGGSGQDKSVASQQRRNAEMWRASQESLTAAEA